MTACRPASWHFAKVALVTAVERFRPSAAMGTVCANCTAPDRHMHDLVTQLYLLDNEPFARRQQQLWIHFVGGPAIRQAGVVCRYGPARRKFSG
jgi:hypothetical protein